MSDRSGRHLTATSVIAGSLDGVIAFAVLVSAACASWAAPPEPRQLGPEARQAFARYTALTEARNQAELESGTYLLWIDRLPENERRDAYQAVRRGDVKLKKLDTRADGSAMRCPGCLIHHWVGVAFLPGAKVDDVLSVLEDYDHHADYYPPDVERSKLLAHDGDHFRAFLRFRRHKVITVVLNTEHDVHYFRDGAQAAHSRSSATHIAEVDNPGRTNERE